VALGRERHELRHHLPDRGRALEVVGAVRDRARVVVADERPEAESQKTSPFCPSSDPGPAPKRTASSAAAFESWTGSQIPLAASFVSAASSLPLAEFPGFSSQFSSEVPAPFSDEPLKRIVACFA